MNDPPRRRFMRPWKVIEHDGSYEVQDTTGLPLASVYFENETIRQSSTRRLSKDEARRVAAQIARLPILLRIERVLIRRDLRHFGSGAEGEGKMSHPAKKWTSEEDEHLLYLKARGLTLRMLAKSLNRTEASVDSRLGTLRRRRANNAAATYSRSAQRRAYRRAEDERHVFEAGRNPGRSRRCVGGSN